MSLAFELFCALRYLRSKRKEVFVSVLTVISILGVAISVMVLDMVLAIITGFSIELKSKLVSSSPHILVRNYVGSIYNSSKVLREVKAHPEVESAFIYSIEQAMLNYKGKTQGVFVRGLEGQEEALKGLNAVLVNGADAKDLLYRDHELPIIRPDGSEDVVILPPLVIGRTLQKYLGIEPGEAMTVFAPDFTTGPQGLMPKLRRFVVTGIYESGLPEYERSIVYTSLNAAQKFFQKNKNPKAIELSVKDVFDAPRIAREIENLLGSTMSGFFATDWSIPNQSLWDALELEQRVYYIVLLLLIIIASFSIVSTLVMVVMEKGRDIAILKVMGAKDGVILRIFFYQGLIIGSLGAFIGTIAGFVGCIILREYGFPLDKEVFPLDSVPVNLDVMNFVQVSLSSFVMTILACIYPALRAARMIPIEALRYE